MAIFCEAVSQIAIDRISQYCGYQSSFRRFGGASLIDVKIFVDTQNVGLPKQSGFFLRKAIVAVFMI